MLNLTVDPEILKPVVDPPFRDLSGRLSLRFDVISSINIISLGGRYVVEFVILLEFEHVVQHAL